MGTHRKSIVEGACHRCGDPAGAPRKIPLLPTAHAVRRNSHHYALAVRYDRITARSGQELRTCALVDVHSLIGFRINTSARREVQRGQSRR